MPLYSVSDIRRETGRSVQCIWRWLKFRGVTPDTISGSYRITESQRAQLLKDINAHNIRGGWVKGRKRK